MPKSQTINQSPDSCKNPEPEGRDLELSNNLTGHKESSPQKLEQSASSPATVDIEEGNLIMTVKNDNWYLFIAFILDHTYSSSILCTMNYATKDLKGNIFSDL